MLPVSPCLLWCQSFLCLQALRVDQLGPQTQFFRQAQGHPLGPEDPAHHVVLVSLAAPLVLCLRCFPAHHPHRKDLALRPVLFGLSVLVLRGHLSCPGILVDPAFLVIPGCRMAQLVQGSLVFLVGLHACPAVRHHRDPLVHLGHRLFLQIQVRRLLLLDQGVRVCHVVLADHYGQGLPGCQEDFQEEAH